MSGNEKLQPFSRSPVFQPRVLGFNNLVRIAWLLHDRFIAWEWSLYRAHLTGEVETGDT